VLAVVVVSPVSRTDPPSVSQIEEPGVRTMPEGTIKKIVSDRGFGFIASEDGKEYFFHRSAIDNFDALRGGERVTFDTEPSPKGPRAARVRVA
jgi:CspA family cold shock protein